MTWEFSEFIKKYISECKECGKCFERCYAYKKTNYPIFKHLKAFFEKRTNYKKIKKFLNSCLYCKNCNNACVSGLDRPLLIPAIKFNLYKINTSYTWTPGNIPNILAKPIRSPRFYYFLRYLNQLIIPEESRSKFNDYRAPQNRDVVFFSGCGIQLLENQYYNILDILEKLNIDFGLIDGSYHGPICCGAIHFEIGNFKYGQFLLKNLIKQIKKFGTNKVIVYCATCYYSLKKLAPNLIKDYNLEIMHASEYIAEILKNKEKKILKAPERENQVITIHDSCHLAHSGDTVSIRNLLSILPSTSISEMKHNKMHALCDAFLILRSLNNPFSFILNNHSLPIVDEALETKADILCTLCPGCHTIQTIFGNDIWTILGKKKQKIPIKNWVTILGEYLGIKRRDMLIYRFSHIISFPFKESGIWYLWQVLKAIINGYFGKRELPNKV